MGMSADVDARLDAVQSRLADREVEGLILFPSPNLYYLSGFHEEPGERHLLLIVTPESAAFVAPTMYESHIRDASTIASIRTWDDSDDPVAVVDDVLASTGLAGTDGRVLLDDGMFALFVLDLQSLLPRASFGLASDVLEELRITKDAAELDALRRAAAISDAACMAIRRRGSEIVGMTEREVVSMIGREIDGLGGDGFSFDPIVGSGPNGAKPHHRSGDRQIEAGDPVVLDFGTVVDGYPGDQTRTVVFAGDPPAEFERVHQTVLAAFEAGVAAVAPGVTAETVDAAARSVIDEAGYGDAFVHRTGHGVGLEVHEPPYIVEGNTLTLEPGMVHSVEPGIYLEGRFGVRIEDLVVVTDDGCEQLNDTPRSWGPL